MDLSILIPVSNHLELTRECLGSLERTTHGLRWEVILVDDGSTDGTSEFLRGLYAPRYRTIPSGDGAPHGPAACLNAAARLARAPILCLLSPAAVLMPGWIQPMLRMLRRLPKAGCVGNIHREPISGLIDHTGVLFNVDGAPADAGHSTTAPPPEPFTRWPAASASCCVLPVSLHARLCGFDENMPLELAGIDFCLRAAEDLGRRHYTANRSVIYLHTEGGPDESFPIGGRHRFHMRWGARALAYEKWEQIQLAAENDLLWRTAGSSFAAPPGQPGGPVHWEDFSRTRERLWQRRWEIAREQRRQWRQDILDGREDGWRYLRKHLLRPWRYNFSRVCQALVKVTPPLPPPIQKPPRYPRARHPGALLKDAADEDQALGHPDAYLFNPPEE